MLKYTGQIEDRKKAQESARKIFPDTFATIDDMVIEV
jgi:hypothetical protein